MNGSVSSPAASKDCLHTASGCIGPGYFHCKATLLFDKQVDFLYLLVAFSVDVSATKDLSHDHFLLPLWLLLFINVFVHVTLAAPYLW